MEAELSDFMCFRSGNGWQNEMQNNPLFAEPIVENTQEVARALSVDGAKPPSKITSETVELHRTTIEELLSAKIGADTAASEL